MDNDKSPHLRLGDNVYVSKIMKNYGINQYFKRPNSVSPNMKQYVPSNL